MKKHLIQMAIAGGVVLTGLVVFGVPLSTALPYALLLACPVMMIWMMASMNHATDSGNARREHDCSKEQ